MRPLLLRQTAQPNLLSQASSAQKLNTHAKPADHRSARFTLRQNYSAKHTVPNRETKSRDFREDHCIAGVPNEVCLEKPVAPLASPPPAGKSVLEFPRELRSGFRLQAPACKPPQLWSWRRESNPRPSDYKSDALPTELRQQKLGKGAPSRKLIPRIPSRCPGQLFTLSQGQVGVQWGVKGG